MSSTDKTMVIVLIFALFIFGTYQLTKGQDQSPTRKDSLITREEQCNMLKQNAEAKAASIALSSQGESVTGTLATNTVEFTGPNSLIRTITLAEFPNQSFKVEAKGQGNETNSTLDITIPGTKVILVVKNDRIIYVAKIPC